MSGRSGSRGFTLIEIMVSLVILSIALLGIASLMTTTTKGNAAGGRMTEATTLAQDKLEQLRATPYAMIETTQDSMTSSTGMSYVRNWAVAENADQTLKTVTIGISWNDGGAHSVSVLSVIAK